MDTTELCWQTAASWGAFLFGGMLEYEASLESDHYLIDHFAGGYLELVGEITALLPSIWQVAIHHPRWETDHPGVFEYEVVGSLGEFLAEQLVTEQKLPSPEAFMATLHFSVRQFFNQA